MNVQRKWGSLAVIVFLAYLVLSGNRGLWNLYKLHQDKKNLTEQIVQLQSEIDRYQIEYQNFSKNNSAVEKQARDRKSVV